MSSSSQIVSLIGFRGTGKSSLARPLASRLNRRVVDLDQLIIEREQRSIADIFQQDGEDVFRDIESRLLKEQLAMPPAVISTGGGIVIRPAHRVWLKSAGPVVWLDASAETIFQRLKNDQTTATFRPALTNLSELDEIKHLLELRRPWYQEASTIHLRTDHKSVDELLAELWSVLISQQDAQEPAKTTKDRS